MLKPGDIAVVSGVRTPMGRYGGKLRDFTAQELGAVAGKGAIERSGLYMANTAELYGEQQGITREKQDEFALRSQKCADDAFKAGRLQEELVPVPLRDRRGEPTGEMFTEDDHRRPQTTLDGLAKLK